MGPHAHGPQGDAVTVEFVLLHDEGGTAADWQELIEVLEGRGHRALALRLPGGRWVDEAEFVRDHVAPGETILVGHALGGLLARWFATVHPDMAKAIGTIATPPAAGEEEASVRFDVPGGEPRIAVVCEGDDVVDYDAQKRSAAQWRAPSGSVPGGHFAHRKHPALVATLLINWLAPETT